MIEPRYSTSYVHGCRAEGDIGEFGSHRLVFKQRLLPFHQPLVNTVKPCRQLLYESFAEAKSKLGHCLGSVWAVFYCMRTHKFCHAIQARVIRNHRRAEFSIDANSHEQCTGRTQLASASTRARSSMSKRGSTVPSGRSSCHWTSRCSSSPSACGAACPRARHLGRRHR